MDTSQLLQYRLLEETIGILLEILSNEFKEMPGFGDTVNSYQEIVFKITEEEPDLWAIGVLYTLSLMSFSFAAPRGYSAEYFIPDEQWIIKKHHKKKGERTSQLVGGCAIYNTMI